MEKGQRYDEAALSAGYKHFAPQNIKRSPYLPAPDKEEIRNPVVYRSLNQARKLVNAIIKKYGPPKAIHIEMARDLSTPYSEREKIKKAQGEYKKEKDAVRNEYEGTMGHTPNGLDLLKWRLYKQQNGQCAYSLKSIDLNRLSEIGYVEVDHVL